MVRTPPYLKPGDTIGIVCPAGYMAAEKVQACVGMLRSWGYYVKTGMTVGSSSANYFSGSDEERLTDFQQMLDDEQISAILCGRGGYGMSRIIDRIDFSAFEERPKWIIGFSDITLLHSHIFFNYNIATIHGPMAGAFNNAGPDDPYLQSLRKVMEGKKISYSAEPDPLNRSGEVIGELIGGNLSLIAHGIGTPSEIKTKGRILVLEDVGEYLYNADRMFYQLRRAGKFDKLGGLILGGFTAMKDTERPFGLEVKQIIHDVVSGFDFPVCFDFPVSHGGNNLAIKIGVGYKLKVGRKKVTLAE